MDPKVQNPCHKDPLIRYNSHFSESRTSGETLKMQAQKHFHEQAFFSAKSYCKKVRSRRECEAKDPNHDNIAALMIRMGFWGGYDAV